MKKNYIKLFLISVFVLVGTSFSLFFIFNTKVSAQTNQLPIISFASPSNGAIFNVGESISLNISASDPDGIVDLVTLFEGNLGGTIIKAFDVPPYTYSISQTTPGDYIYSAQVFDNMGSISSTSITLKIIQSTIPPSPPLPPPLPATEDSNTGLVPCTNSCDFYDIMTLINNIVNFTITALVIPVAAIMFAYAGFELLTSGGETSKREKAKNIFLNVSIGLIIAVAAFIIVQTVLSLLGYDKSWDWFGF